MEYEVLRSVSPALPDRLVKLVVDVQAAPRVRPAEAGFRQFGLGAQVLHRLGLRRIRVMTNNPRKIIGLTGFGIEVDGTVPLEGG